MAFDLATNIIITAQDKTGAAISSASAGVQGLEQSYRRLLTTLGAGLSVGYFVSLIKSTIDAADRLNDLHKVTNLTVEDLAGLRLLAKQTGTDLDGLAKGISKMSVEMGKDPEKFRALGITAKTNKEAFQQFADIFNLLPDINQRNALSQKVFAKSWQEMAPALSEGGKRIGEIIEKGARLSGITKEITDEADKFNDKWAELVGTGGLLIRLVGPMLPMLNDLADDMLKVTEKTDGLKSSFSPLAEMFRTLIILGANVSFTFTTIGKDIARMFENVKLIFSGDFAGSRALGETFRKDAAAARKELDAYEKKIMGLGLKGPSSGWVSGSDLPTGIGGAASAAAAARAKAFLDADKEAKDLDATYRGLLKTLKEKLLVDKDLTEVAKLQLTLDALSAKNRATITPEREKELKALAAEVDLNKQEKKSFEERAKAEKEYNDLEKNNEEFLYQLGRERDKQLESAKENVKQIEFETTLIGLSNVQREQAIFLRQSEKDAIDATTIARGMEAIAARSAAQEAKDSQVSMWQSVESAGHQAFLSIFDTSKSVLERIRDMLKTHLIDILYQMTIKKWIIQVAASTSGAGVAQSALGSSGGIGGASSLMSGAGLLSNFGGMNGLGYAYGAAGLASAGGVGSGIGAAMMTAAPVYEGGVLISGATYGSAVAGGAAAGAGIGSMAIAVPYVGLALAAAYALGAFDSPGDAQRTSNYTGQFGASANGQYNYPNNKWFSGDMWTGQQGIDAQLQTSEQAMITKLGLTTSQIGAVNARISANAGTQYGFGVEHTDVSQSGALGAVAADRIRMLAETLGVSVEQLAQRLTDAQKTLDLAPAKHQLEISLMEAQGKAVEALAARRADELKTLDPTLHALAKQIYAQQDLAEAAEKAAQAQQAAAEKAAQIASERYGLETQLLQLQGNTVALRARELAALDPTLWALQKQIYATQDLATASAAAAQAAAELAQQQEAQKAVNQSWRDQASVLSGLFTQEQLDRANALASTTDQSTKFYMNLVFSLQDAKAAAENLAAASSAAAKAQQDQAAATETARRGIAANESSLGSAVAGLASKLGIDTLRKAANELAISSSYSSPTAALSAAQVQMAQTLAQARGGDLGAVQAFPQALQSVLTLGRDVYASGPQFQALFVEGNRQLNELLTKQLGTQTEITKDIPLTIQESGANTVATLKTGFRELKEELAATRAELRRLTANG